MGKKFYDLNENAHIIRDISLTPTEIAKILKCSRDSVYRWRKILKVETDYVVGLRGPDRVQYWPMLKAEIEKYGKTEVVRRWMEDRI